MPQYTMAKSCDHEIVRALEAHPMAIPYQIEIKFSVVAGLLSVV